MTARLASVSALVAAVAFASPAQAQNDDPRGTARLRAERGDVAFAAGRCDQAIPLWRDADRAFHAPTIVLRIARCQALLGRVVEAAGTLETIANDKLGADAPPAFVEAQSQARAELPAVRSRMATLTLEEPKGMRLTQIRVDDVPRDAAKKSFSMDPGRHIVRAEAGAGTAWEGSVELADGEARTLRLAKVLEPGPEPPHTVRNIGFVLGGAGLVAMGVGAVAGVSALTLAGPLEDSCGPERTSCPPNSNDRIGSVKSMSLLSDVFLVGGLVLAGAGGYLIFRDMTAEKPPPRVRLVVGSALRLEGRF